ncbi:MAG TPA: hypothetical protein VHZ95_02730, partial [Polyangiales bacterium]|nr:hypothetical protein [Polyangiales bacterium]
AALQPAQRKLYWLFVAMALLSQLIFPRGYPVLKAMHPVAIVLLNVRNFGLVMLCALLVRAYSKPLSRRDFNR